MGSKQFIEVGRNGFSTVEVIGDFHDVCAVRYLEILNDVLPCLADHILLSL